MVYSNSRAGRWKTIPTRPSGSSRMRTRNRCGRRIAFWPGDITRMPARALRTKNSAPSSMRMTSSATPGGERPMTVLGGPRSGGRSGGPLQQGAVPWSMPSTSTCGPCRVGRRRKRSISGTPDAPRSRTPILGRYCSTSSSETYASAHCGRGFPARPRRGGFVTGPPQGREPADGVRARRSVGEARGRLSEGLVRISYQVS